MDAVRQSRPRGGELIVAAVCLIVMAALAAGGYLRDPKDDVTGALIDILAFMAGIAAGLRVLFGAEQGWGLRMAAAALLAAILAIFFYWPRFL